MKKEKFETIMDELHEILVSGYKLSNSDKNLLMNNVLRCITEYELVKYCDISVLEYRLSKLNQAEVIKSVCDYKGLRCEFKLDDGTCDADNNCQYIKQTGL